MALRATSGKLSGSMVGTLKYPIRNESHSPEDQPATHFALPDEPANNYLPQNEFSRASGRDKPPAFVAKTAAKDHSLGNCP